MKKQILALSLCALTAMPASAAIDCATLPSCKDLGYSDTVDNCMVESYAIKCPFDQTKGKCQDGGPFIGEIRMMAVNFIPNGWMICDGRALDEATYSALYSVIGENYSTYANAQTYNKKFNIPDLRSRVPVGVGQGSGLTQYSFGASGGEEKHTLTISEMPSHNHDLNFDNNKWGDNADRRPFPNAAGTHTYDAKTLSTGGGQAHENRMPYVAVRYIIYTGVVKNTL